MTKEEFNKLWKDSTREEILNQYYYDYKELQRTNNIINELEKWIKENDLGKYRTENVVDTDELLNKLQELKGDSSNDNNGNI